MRIEQFNERSTEPCDPYASRIDDRYEERPRIDPVVYSNMDKDGDTLTKEQKQEFDRNGFLILEGAFSEKEVAAFNAELSRLAQDPEITAAPGTITEPSSGDVRSIFEIHKVSPRFDQLSRDNRLLGAARDLLADDLYIHQSRLNYKPGFTGKEFYWHSDFETWHVEDGLPRMRTVSASVLLTDNHHQNGPLMLIPGSHKIFLKCAGITPEDNYRKSLKVQDLGVPHPESLNMLATENGMEVADCKAGTVVLFDCNLLHGSNGNITPFSRSNAFFVFNAISNRVWEPFGTEKPRPGFLAERQPRPETL